MYNDNYSAKKGEIEICYIDTHVHLNADQYDEDLQEVIDRALEANVKKMVVVGFDRKTIERAMKLVEEYAFIYAVIWLASGRCN